MKKCPYCAEEINDAATVCPHCDFNLPTQQSEDQQPSSEHSTSSSIGFCFIIFMFGFLAIFLLVSYLAQLGFFEGAPPPENYSTETPLPTITPIDSAIKEMWMDWNNLKIITSKPNKKCLMTENNMTRISGTIKNDNNFDLRNIKIKGFSCPLGTPNIFGNKPYLSSDENTINYLEKMVTPFPLPILTENTIVISSLPAGEVTSFTVDIPLPSNSRIYCDAVVVEFSR